MTAIEIEKTYTENGYEMTSARIYQEGEYGYVSYLPKCDHCEADAHYDGMESVGVWSFMCDACWAEKTENKLGWGLGQRLIIHTGK